MLTQRSCTDVFEILIVDDTKENALVLKAILQDIGGYRTRVCHDGYSALQAIRENPPDLILLDVVMPGISGYGVCRRLKADPSTQDIPVIFMNNQSGWDEQVTAFMAGGIDFLSKPFYSQEVLSKVFAHLTPCAMRRQSAEMG